MNIGPDTLDTAENESGRAKYEKVTRRPRYRRKRVRERKKWKWDPMSSVPPKMCQGAQNMKTVLDALGTAPNEPGNAKHENKTRRPRYLRKWVRDRKTWIRDPTPSVPPKTTVARCHSYIWNFTVLTLIFNNINLIKLIITKNYFFKDFANSTPN
jgi:hypothetical protein